MSKYNDQINEIAYFAKRNGFNPATQFDELMKAWVKMTYQRSIMIQQNKIEVMAIVKKSI